MAQRPPCMSQALQAENPTLHLLSDWCNNLLLFNSGSSIFCSAVGFLTWSHCAREHLHVCFGLSMKHTIFGLVVLASKTTPPALTLSLPPLVSAASGLAHAAVFEEPLQVH